MIEHFPFNAVGVPVLVIGILGCLFALVLALVAKKFGVHQDEGVLRIVEALPGLNCGGCGFPSCQKYAEGLYYHPHLPVTFCKPGGDEVAQKLAEILGRSFEKEERQVAKLLCRGGKNRAIDKFIYNGPALCRAAHSVKNGFKVCEQGCLGFADCFNACQFHAIEMGESKLPFIDRDKCVSCGACVKACPRGLIQLIPEGNRVFVECKNTDKGASVTKACEVGCIACRLCEKECPVDAIHVVSNVAVIDYKKCINCGKCVRVCPRNIILQLPKLKNVKKESIKK